MMATSVLKGARWSDFPYILFLWIIYVEIEGSLKKNCCHKNPEEKELSPACSIPACGTPIILSTLWRTMEFWVQNYEYYRTSLTSIFSGDWPVGQPSTLEHLKTTHLPTWSLCRFPIAFLERKTATRSELKMFQLKATPVSQYIPLILPLVTSQYDPYHLFSEPNSWILLITHAAVFLRGQ